jgi:polar amino acid transport system substrate-binding protein
MVLFILPIVSKYGEKKTSSEIRDQICFGTSAEYPPFENVVNGKIVGFDMDLAEEVAKIMNKTAVFKDMEYPAVLPSLTAGHIDAAISAIERTPDRELTFDFSTPYYKDNIYAVYPNTTKIEGKQDLAQKRVTCQTGSTMHEWIKKLVPDVNMKEIIILNDVNMAIESLKQGLTDVVIVDGSQAGAYCHQNPSLNCAYLDEGSGMGYAIAFKKGSRLLPSVNSALVKLIENGTMAKLIEKWVTPNS